MASGLTCKGNFPQRLRKILEGLAKSIQEAGIDVLAFQPLWQTFLHEVEKAVTHPHVFAPYHQKIRQPLDYYRFSLDFIRPLVILQKSKMPGRERWREVQEAVARGENAILLANHQTEADPQAMALLLETDFPQLAEHLIYVAGERVVTDPVAIPFSMGCDLLCIYSKRYIDHPSEERERKQMHNREVMVRMSRLLARGGKVIYVAPSGGRDRRNAAGTVEVAPFDPDSIELFYLMAQKAKTATHFYPLALKTHALMPPPDTVQRELGENRTVNCTPIGMALAPRFDMSQFVEAEKGERRTMRAHAIWTSVHTLYETL